MTTIQRLTVDGAELPYEDRGTGRPVVLLHAGALDLHQWDRHADALARDHRVVRYSGRGYGDATTPQEPFAPTDDLFAVLDHLQIARATLVGVSYGARTALEAALLQPDRVAALLLTAPALGQVAFVDPLLADQRAAQARALEQLEPKGWVDAFVSMWVDGPYRSAEQVDPDVRRWCHDTILRNVLRHEPAPGRPADLEGATDRLGEISAPTLVVNGTLDSIDHHRASGRIAAGVPDARVVDVEAHHMVDLDAPGTFGAVLDAFVAATAPVAERPGAEVDLTPAVAAGHPPAGLLAVDGGGLAVDDRGAGPAVVLLHGGMLDRHMWDAETALLSAGHRVVRYDARGHGGSTTPFADFAPHEDLRVVLDSLGIGSAVLVGHSLGARTAVDLAVAAPERVTAMLLAAPGVGGMALTDPDLAAARGLQARAVEERDAAGYVEGFLRLWVDGPRRAPDDVEWWLRDRCRRSATATVALHGDATGQPQEVGAIGRLEELTMPVEVVVGALDSSDVHDVAGRIVDQAADARLTSLDAVGHTLTLERPEAWIPVLSSFVARHADADR